jgi:hypothetical protein
MDTQENSTQLRSDLFRCLQPRCGSKLIIFTLLLTMLALMPPGRWQTVATAQKEESLFSRIVRAIELKEPDWKIAQKEERKGAEQKYYNQGWTQGDEYVSTSTYQLTDSTAATKAMEEFIHSPVSAPVHIRKVPDLGDEAYTIGESPYGKKGAGTLVVRRVNIMIRLDASSLETAKRFAKHMLEEVDAMCGGALCEPMGSVVELNP